MSVPQDGRVYASPYGERMVFLRTDYADTEPEHIFLVVRCGHAVYLRSREIPAELTLIHDPEASAHLEQVSRERDALVLTMREAVRMLGPGLGQKLRDFYRKQRASS